MAARYRRTDVAGPERDHSVATANATATQRTRSGAHQEETEQRMHKIVYRSAAAVATVLIALTAAPGPAQAGNPFKVHHRTLADCEDSGRPTCFMKDDGTWRVVTSFDPYRYRAVRLCNTRRTNLPCLGKGRTTSGGTLRVVYWRGGKL